MAVNWHTKHKADLTLGQRAADHLRNGMGSWWFIFGALTFLAIWILVAPQLRLDNPQLTILNLVLSCLAALQGGILLIAAKRQDALAGAMAQHDYDTNVASKKEIEDLTILVQGQVQLLEDVKELLEQRSR